MAPDPRAQPPANTTGPTSSSSIATTIASLVTGLLVFQRVEKSFVDVV